MKKFFKKLLKIVLILLGILCLLFVFGIILLEYDDNTAYYI